MKMRTGRRMGVVVAVALGALSGGVVARPGDTKLFPDEYFFDGAQRPAPLKALEGKPAAALSIDTWIGAEVSIAENRGKVIIVDFWATWCGPCMASIPHNVELAKKYKDQGLVFVGVHDSNSGWDRADGVVKEKGINYSVGLDKSGGVSTKAYAVQFWPTYVAIDRNGIVRAAGLIPDKVDEVVKVLLAEDAPAAGPSAGASEFGAEFYLGGAGRPRSLKEVEGKPAGKFKAAGWAGKELTEAEWKDHVTVVTFVSPSLAVSMNELEKTAPLAKDFGPQGVVFVGVADARGGEAGWKKLTEFVKAKSIATSVMQDTTEQKTNENGKQVTVNTTAAGFGVNFFPSNVVIDRTGKVRAAGVKTDKLKSVIEKLLAETAGK